MPQYAAMAHRLLLVAAAVSTARASTAGHGSPRFTSREVLPQPAFYEVPCAPRPTLGTVPGCTPTKCGRYMEDGLMTTAELTILQGMVTRGMARSTVKGGPTILDANTGYMRDADGLTNVYRTDDRTGAPPVNFTAVELATYRSTFDRIKERVMRLFGLRLLYFTAPTFITRIVGSPSWQPAGIHDEYYHPHVDGENTPHYHYSGLVYMSTEGQDFTEGEFAFLRAGAGSGTGGNAGKDGGEGGGAPPEDEHVVEPRAGRLLIFTAGAENLHQVRRVATGTRYVFSMWFTCDARREFTTFLDGKAHDAFRKPASAAPAPTAAAATAAPAAVAVDASAEFSPEAGPEQTPVPGRAKPGPTRRPPPANVISSDAGKDSSDGGRQRGEL
jgi:hypothetical protein